VSGTKAALALEEKHNNRQTRPLIKQKKVFIGSSLFQHIQLMFSVKLHTGNGK
jgi:hypothetical protein